MKVEIFVGSVAIPLSLEEKINRFFIKGDKSFVSALQSQNNDTIIITVFYR